MDIAAWLRELGLERYAQAFRDNDVDVDLLSDLSEADLEKLGVASLGHRKILLRAMEALRRPLAELAEGVTDIADEARPTPPPPASGPEAERRQLTVLFCDLVGSTELAARLDPEDMSAVIRAYQNTVAGEIARFEGHVAKYMGDGVLAYFGWPRAHEDEAERAVRAGLAVVEAVGKVATPTAEPLAARVGIATGLVVVGELIGVGAAQEQAVAGETPNLAARLQALAAPGAVVVSKATRRLVGGLFELSDLGPQRLKGFAEPLTAWRVEGEGRAEGRFEALHGERLTPLVGREHELGILLERWGWAKDGDGQVVLLSGEPGIGKSRLIRALRERLGDEPYTPLSHFCSPHHTNSALYPVIGLLERAARLDRDDPPEVQLAKLEVVLGRSSDRLDEVVPLLAALLGVPTSERYPALTLTPEVQKRRTLEALVDQLAGLATQQPVLALYEDVHWIDPSTLELLDVWVERIRELPVLMLITFRPDFQPPWTSQAHVTTLTMSRLGRRQGADLVTRVTGHKALPAAIVEQIVAHTDGVPLFVEELTKTVPESGLLADAGDRYELSGHLPPLAIPTTLHDSLMARLDRLAPVKEVAQIGAVIGREFSHDLLAAIADRPEDQLDSALDQLVASELVFRRGTPPDATYSFKHTLVRDVAYDSLLRSRRQQLHAKVAGVLRERFQDLASSQPEILAHHCTEAGLTEEAIGYWQVAGRLAAERSANAEAAAHFRRGVELLRTSPGTAEDHERELDLLTMLGSMVVTTKHGDPEVERVYTRARELCHLVGTTPHLAPVLQGLRIYHMLRAELAPAREAARDLLTLGERTQKSDYLLEGHRAMGLVLFQAGEFEAARDHLEQGIALYRVHEHGTHALRYEGDPGETCLGYVARTLWVLGYPDQAVARGEQAIGVARATSHAGSVAEAMAWRAEIALFCREVQNTAERALATLALAIEHGLPLWIGMATAMHGWTLSVDGQSAHGLSRIRDGLSVLARTGDRLLHPYYVAMLAEALGKAGQVDEGLSALDEAIQSYRKSGVPYWDSELQRLNGELLLAKDEPDAAAAEACFHRSIEIAQAQSAKSLELRAATSLARLWSDQGERQRAHDLLAPVYGWFTEGFDTADLKDAKALLDELG